MEARPLPQDFSVGAFAHVRSCCIIHIIGSLPISTPLHEYAGQIDIVKNECSRLQPCQGLRTSLRVGMQILPPTVGLLSARGVVMVACTRVARTGIEN